MLEIDECIFYWKTYQDQHENSMTDHQLKAMASTIRHLVDYKKLKEDVSAQLPLVNRNATR